MFPNEWGKYQSLNTDQVLEQLLSEEIENLDRYQEKSASRTMAKQRMLDTIVFAALMVVWALIPYSFKGWGLTILLFGLGIAIHKQLQKGMGIFLLLTGFALIANLNSTIPGTTWAVIGTVIFVAIYLLLMHSLGKKDRLRHLMAQAKANPEKDLGQIVREDSYIVGLEKPFGSSKGLLALLLGVAVVGSGFGTLINCRDSMRSDTDVEFPRLAADAEYTWKRYGNGYMLADFDAGTKAVNPVIPEQIDGLPVVAIGPRAFQNETRVTNVNIPGTVTEIGSYAFKGCTKLWNITMGDQVTAIGGEAFKDCGSLVEFILPAGVTEVRGNTFQNCVKLKNVALHDQVTAIHAYAFSGCSALQEIMLPAGITEIRANTFEYCDALRSIVIPHGVTRIAAHAFHGCSSLKTVEVPQTVCEIRSSAFRECEQLLVITIPQDCTVNERAFKDSPTNVKRYSFTEAQAQQIQNEIDNKQVDTLYAVYHKDLGADKVFCPGESGMVVIADSALFTEKISDAMALQPLTNASQVLDYLQTVKPQGATRVQYATFSQVASDIAGKTWFVGTEYEIDALIAYFQKQMES